MGQYVIRRLAQGVLVIVVVLVMVFVATRMVGNPTDVAVPPDAPQAVRDQLRHQMGLDRPLGVQLKDYAIGVAHLDFGESFWQRQPALEIALRALTTTLLLLAASMTLAFVLGLTLGLVAAARPGSVVDRAVGVVSIIWISTPQFWFGLVLVILFAVTLGWLPTSGSGSLAQLVLPTITLALVPAGRLALIARSSLIEELHADYIAMDRARGFPKRWILGRHALRNVLVPLLTVEGYEVVQALTGGVLLIESVFAWPGLGLLTIQALQRGDLALIQAIAAVVAGLVVLINLAVDIVNRWIDPRLTAVRAHR
jgi:peptide/nickel transport system permease protein